MTSQFGYSLCACVYKICLMVSIIRFRNHLRKAWNTTWCPNHPRKEAKPMDAYWYLGYSWWCILWFVNVQNPCCHWGHNPNTVICCRFFPGDNDLRTKGDCLGFSLSSIDVVFRCPLISPYVWIVWRIAWSKKVKQINEGMYSSSGATWVTKDLYLAACGTSEVR